MSLKKSDLKLAYLDGKHARTDYNNPAKKEQSEMLMKWYEQISVINNTPELYSEFIKGFNGVK